MEKILLKSKDDWDKFVKDTLNRYDDPFDFQVGEPRQESYPIILAYNVEPWDGINTLFGIYIRREDFKDSFDKLVSKLIDAAHQDIDHICNTYKEIIAEDPFVDKLVKDIEDRLKEVYGETLPRELNNQLPYIVSQAYQATLEHCGK